MSRQIAGFITEWDEWKRFRVTFPQVRNGQDTKNTELQLRSVKIAGWSPVKAKSYIAKPEKNCFAYSSGGIRITDFKELVQHDVVFEVDFVPFAGGDAGWWIRVASIRVC